MQADNLGSLLCASAEGIESIDVLSGRRRWTNISYEAMETRRAWPLGSHLLVENRTSSLATIAIDDGEMSEPFRAAARGEWDLLSLADVYVADDAIFAHYRQRIIRFDSKGHVLGADVVSDKRNYRWLLPADDGLIVISQHDSRQVAVENRAGRRTQWTYRLYIMSENLRLIGEAIELPPLTRRLREAALIDGLLLLSTDAETLALPMPADN